MLRTAVYCVLWVRCDAMKLNYGFWSLRLLCEMACKSVSGRPQIQLWTGTERYFIILFLLRWRFWYWTLLSHSQLQVIRSQNGILHEYSNTRYYVDTSHKTNERFYIVECSKRLTFCRADSDVGKMISPYYMCISLKFKFTFTTRYRKGSSLDNKNAHYSQSCDSRSCMFTIYGWKKDEESKNMDANFSIMLIDLHSMW